MRRASLNEGDNFQFTIVPSISEVTNQGNKDGQKIEIKGSGFSTNPRNNTVEVDGNECNVTQSTPTSITCILSAHNASKTKKL